MKNRFTLSLILVGMILGAALYALHHWRDRRQLTQVPVATENEVDVQEESYPSVAPRKLDVRRDYCADAHAATCGAAWPSVDPTGKVRPDVTGEVRALRLMRNIIRDHPHWTSEQVQEKLAEAIYSDARRRRAEQGFVWVLESLKSFVKNQPVLSGREKKAVLNRLGRIVLELPPPAAVYADAADLLTKNTVYYERTPKGDLRLRMGGAYLLNTTSWYNVVFTIAHELAHAIDPCEMKQADLFPKAYGALVSCFVKAGWISPQRAECGPNEQVSEVFADWLASHIVGLALLENGRTYSSDDRARAAINATRDLCDQPAGADALNFTSHQEPEIRIGLIMGKNPLVRSALACRNYGANYCQLGASMVQAPRKENRQ